MKRRRASSRDFNDVLEFCLNELTAGRLTLNECIDMYPQLTGRLAPLLRVADAFVRARGTQVQASARDSLEQWLRMRIAKLPAPRGMWRRRHPSFVRWASIALTVLAAVILAGAGTVAAASGSLPGEWLYPVKRWSESASLQFSSQVGRVELHVQWAQRRLEEYEALSARGVVAASLLNDFQIESQAVIVASGALREPQRSDTLNRIVSLSTRALAAASNARSDVATGLENASATMEDLRASALQALELSLTPEPTATGTPSPTGTPAPAPIFTHTPSGQGTPGSGHAGTPSGQGTPGSGLTRTPSGQGTLDGGPAGTLLGQSTPGGGLTRTPPGQGTPGGGHESQPTKTPKPTKDK